MKPSPDDQLTAAGPSDPAWRTIRVIGGIAALLAALVFRRWLSAEFAMLRGIGVIRFDLNPEPSTPLQWFTLLQGNRLAGLLMLNVFDVVNYLLVGLVYLGACSVLGNVRRVPMLLVACLTLAGIAMHLATHQAFSLLALSKQYAAATGESQRSLILAAGQAALNANDPLLFGGGLFWSYMFLYLAGLITAIVMVRTGLFGRWTGVMGILASSFGLGYFVTSAFAPTLGIVPAVGSAPFHLAWYLLTGLRLLGAGRRPFVPPAVR